MEDNLLFEIGDTIKIVKGEMEKNGFYIAHEIMRPDLYDKNAEESRVLGYRRIQSLNVYGKKNMIYSKGKLQRRVYIWVSIGSLSWELSL